MRRLLAAGSLAAVVAFGAACGDDNDGGDTTGEPTGEPAGNTEQICTDAAAVQTDELQALNEDLSALQQEDLPEDEFEQQALTRMETGLVDMSDGLQEQADRADDGEVADALTGLADRLSQAATELTPETLQTGEIPGAEDLQGYNQTLNELCQPSAPASPQTPSP